MKLGMYSYEKIFVTASPAVALKEHETNYFANRAYLDDFILLLSEGYICAAVKLLWDTFSGNGFVNIRNAILDGFSQRSGNVVNIYINKATTLKLTQVPTGVEIQWVGTLTGQTNPAILIEGKTLDEFHLDFKKEFNSDPTLSTENKNFIYLTDDIEPGPAQRATYEGLTDVEEPMNAER